MKPFFFAAAAILLSLSFFSCEDWAEYEAKAVLSARKALLLSQSNVIKLPPEQWNNFPSTNFTWQPSDFDQWNVYANLSTDKKVLWIQFSKPQEFDRKITVQLDVKSLKPISVTW